MSEVVRHFPLTQEQQSTLKELRESASLEAQLTPVASHSPNAYAEQAYWSEYIALYCSTCST